MAENLLEFVKHKSQLGLLRFNINHFLTDHVRPVVGSQRCTQVLVVHISVGIVELPSVGRLAQASLHCLKQWITFLVIGKYRAAHTPSIEALVIT